MRRPQRGAIWGYGFLVGVLILGIAAPVRPQAGPWTPLNLAPAGDEIIPAPSARVLTFADAPGWEAPPSDAGSVAVRLAPNARAARIGDGGDLMGARTLPALQVEAFDVGDVPRRDPGDRPVPSFGAAAGREAPSVDLLAAMLAIDLTPRSVLQALQPAASEAPRLPANIQVSGVLIYRYVNAPVPPLAGDVNINGLAPTPDQPTLHDGILEVAVNWALSPAVSVFADLALEYRTDVQFNNSDIEQFYFDVHNLFGMAGSGIRLGRTRIKLGFDGLLLDETVFDGGRRDGVEARLRLGPLSLLGFMQYALDDGLQLGSWTSTRRVWGARAEAEVVPGWAIDLSYRADTAGAVEAGTCPGTACNVGYGFSVGLQGTLVPGMNLIMEAATYTQPGDIARRFYEASLALDLQQLLGIPSLPPVLTLWYKNFDPYTLPLDAPLGHLLTPDDFKIFNTNDNLAAMGARLDLSITPALSVFALAERGTYKDRGPNYTVYSTGTRYALSANTLLKAAYNVYAVDGGTVTTSPVSGLQLGNAQVVQVELTRTF